MDPTVRTNLPESPGGSDSSTGPGEASGAPPSGTFRGWRIDHRLPAKGGEADIFVVSRGSEQRILKLYRFGITPNPEVFSRLMTFGKQHPGLCVGIHECGTDESTSCFYEFNEYIAGGTLGDRMTGSPWPQESVAAMLHQLAEALEALHAFSILHLDLKPSNILLRDPGAVPVLADFGLSSLFDPNLSVKVTQTKGTSLYQSPESLTGVVTPKSDWWSLGMIILELLTGQHPFARLQKQVILYQLTSKGVEIPAALAPTWKLLLQGLLTRDPGKRWGGRELAAWRAGTPPPTAHENEAAATNAGETGTLSLAGPANEFGGEHPFAQPLRLRRTASGCDTFCRSLTEFFTVAFSAPDAWKQACVMLTEGKLAACLQENTHDAALQHLTHLAKHYADPDRQLFAAALSFQPALPLSWQGLPVSPESLTVLCNKAAQGGLNPAEESLLALVWSGELFRLCTRLTGKAPSAFEVLTKTAQALAGSGLETCSVPEQGILLGAILSGGLAGAGAFEFLAARAEGSDARATVLHGLLKQKGFGSFAAKAGLWTPTDRLLWDLALESLPKISGNRVPHLREMVSQSVQIAAGLQKDPTLRDIVSRIIQKKPFDMAAMKLWETLIERHPWLERPARLAFQFPENVAMAHGMACLTVGAQLAAPLITWEKKYLIPPFLRKLFLNQTVTPEQLADARAILETPGRLPPKGPVFFSWADLVAGVPPELSLKPDSLAYGEWAKARGAQLTRREYLGNSLSFIYRAGVFLGLPLLILLIALPNFRRTGHYPQKSCYANMRVILGAVEMYNMDHSVFISTEFNLEPLIKQGYLKATPECRGTRIDSWFPRSLVQPYRYGPGGTYSYAGDMSQGGKVQCSEHGTVD
jgi:competence protein ComGC